MCANNVTSSKWNGEKATGHAKHNGVILLRDKFEQRHRFTLQHKHNTSTDLEAPVVWLLLRGEKNKEERR